MRRNLWPDGTEDHAREIAMFFAGGLEDVAAVLVVESEGGALVGFAELSIRWDLPGLEGKRAGYVEGLYLSPEYRGQGLTRKLLQASRMWAREQGCVAFASDRADRLILDRSFAEPN